ncbi:MAG: acyloxyacyl hydrolase [Hyphomicrobiales bacterium]
MQLKKKRSCASAALATLLVVPNSQMASAKDSLFGAYVELFAGLSTPRNNDISLQSDVASVIGPSVLSVSQNTGFLGGVALGFEIFDNVRTEVELSYQRNGFSDFTASGALAGQPFDEDATFQTTTVFGNVWFDLDFLGSGKISPYFGGGVGLGVIDADLFDNIGSFQDIDVDGAVFAYQLGAGVNFDISSRVNLGVGYRFRGFASTGTGLFSPPFGTSLDGVSPSSHNFIGSVRYKF